jgi:ABC-2 type transport system permease protein
MKPSILEINLIGLSSLVRKEVKRIYRIWVQTIVPPAITMTLYFVIFGSLIGSRIGLVEGYPYMTFIAPGLIMMSIITNSFGNVVASFFSGKLQRHLEELLVSPMSSLAILFGFVTGGVIRGLSVAALVTVVATFFTELTVVHPGITILVVLLTSISFSLAGLINAVFAKNFDDISIIPTFILTPLTYLGGVFFSIDMLSESWQLIARFNPMFYMVNAFRYGMLGVSDIDIKHGLAVIILFTVFLFSIAYYLLKTGKGIRE